MLNAFLGEGMLSPRIVARVNQPGFVKSGSDDNPVHASVKKTENRILPAQVTLLETAKSVDSRRGFAGIVEVIGRRSDQGSFLFSIIVETIGRFH